MIIDPELPFFSRDTVVGWQGADNQTVISTILMAGILSGSRVATHMDEYAKLAVRGAAALIKALNRDRGGE